MPCQRAAPIPGLLASVTEGVGLSGGDGQDRLVSQSVVIVEVFVAQRDAEAPLCDELLDCVLHASGVPLVDEARGHAAKKSLS